MGVLLHDENKLDGMNNILHHFMKYVPTLKRTFSKILSLEETNLLQLG